MFPLSSLFTEPEFPGVKNRLNRGADSRDFLTCSATPRFKPNLLRTAWSAPDPSPARRRMPHFGHPFIKGFSDLTRAASDLGLRFRAGRRLGFPRSNKFRWHPR